jgi:large subunit ribosomal protein L13
MEAKETAQRARRWHLIDAQGKVLGRLACQVAYLLRGKHKPTFTPYEDTGDFVVVVNAQGIRLTGTKERTKVYHRHSGFPGGGKSRLAADQLTHCPEEMLRKAVVGMLPKNRLGRRMAAKVKIYAGADHPHSAQRPNLL